MKPRPFRPAGRSAPVDLEAQHQKLRAQAAAGDEKPLLHFYRSRTRLDPRAEAIWIHWADYLVEATRLDEALKVVEQGLRHCPASCLLWGCQADVLIRLKRHSQAVPAAERAVELNPNHWLGWLMLSATHFHYKPKEAERAARRCLELAPNLYLALNNLGQALKNQGRLGEALVTFEAAHRAAPTHAVILDNLLLTLLYDETARTAQIADWAQRYGALVEGRARPLAARFPPRAEGRRLKLGFVSPDVLDHSVMYFLEPLLARLDRRRFEVWVVATAAGYDAVTERARRLADGWLSVDNLPAEVQARRVQEAGFDVLIDCAGHTGDNGLPLLAWQPAPVQLTWLGYPGTTGLTRIQWRITDAVADMEPSALLQRGLQAHAEPPLAAQYTERQLALATAFCVYRPCIRQPVQRYHWQYAPWPTPALSNGYVTFGCCNNLAKVSDRALKVWGRILAAVPDSRLLIEGQGLDDAEMAEGIRRRAQAAGVDVDRLELVPRDPSNQYLIYHRIDIALDPFPLTGGTTTFDVLWFGLPLVSLEGVNFRSRLSATLLTHLGRTEWLARDENEYVAIALRLAQDVAALDRLRHRLRDEVEQSPLLDEAGFAAIFGAALEAAVDWAGREEEAPFWQPVAAVAADPAADTVALAMGERLTRAEAQARLEALLACVRQAPITPGELTPAWQPVVDFALCILESLPNDRVALLALAECEERHGGDGMAVGYLRAAWREAVREALPRDARQAIERRLFEALGRLNLAEEIRRLAQLATEEDAEDGLAWRYLARARVSLGDWAGALDDILRAQAVQPEDAENYGMLLTIADKTRQWGRALPASLERVRRWPQEARVWAEHAALLYTCGQLFEAEAAARRSIELDDALAHGWYALGQALGELGDSGGAKAAFLQAARLDPAMRAARTNALLAAQADPQTSVAEMVTLARTAAASYGVPPCSLAPAQPKEPWRRLRVGFLSPNLGDHAVMYFVEPLIAQADRAGFEWIALDARAPGPLDAVSARAQRLFDAWHGVDGDAPPERLAEQLRALELDVVVDLAGHTAANMLAALAHRVAPVQVTWLGYPGTTGLPTMDWRLTDPVADASEGQLREDGVPDARLTGIPPLAEQYSEKLAVLPPPFCVYRPHIRAPLARWQPLYAVQPAPALKNGLVTFGSCNNLVKLNDAVLRLWARILEAVPRSRLLIEGEGLQDARMVERLRQRLTACGLPLDRVDLVPRDARNQYLAYHQIDIALDPFPLTGGTASLDALWMGVPIVTLAGGSFRSRMTTSFLTALQAGDWIAQTEDDYVRIAASLASDPARLDTLRQGLRPRMLASPLMDEVGFARRFEEALRQMWLGACAAALHPQDADAQARQVQVWLAERPPATPWAPEVGLAPGQRIPLAEAIACLEALWQEAEAADATTGGHESETPGAAGPVRLAWQPVLALATCILESQPNLAAPAVLPVLANIEWAHGQADTARHYLQQAIALNPSGEGLLAPLH